MTLRLSAADWCFFRPGMDPATYYRDLRSYGYDAVEMVPDERFAAARDAGLEILNLAGPGMMEGLNRREHHAKLVPEIRAALQQASDNSGRRLRSALRIVPAATGRRYRHRLDLPTRFR